MTIEVNPGDQASTFALNIRQPEWATDNLTVAVNGEPVDAPLSNGYHQITREWQAGDKVSFSVNPELHVEQLPDGQDYYSVMYGPIVMATPVNAFADEQLNFVSDDSRMGHVAAGPVCPPEALPMMLGEPQEFLSALKREDSKDLAIKATEHVGIADPADAAAPTTLIPFFRLHDSRYQVYWPQMNESGFNDFVAEAKSRATLAAELQAKTVDQITPGEQQPEVEHDFKSENSESGVYKGRHWRHASGYFQYRLANPELRAETIQISYSKDDTDRQFRILINGETLAQVALPVGTPESDFYHVDYPLTEAMKAAESLVIRFEAAPDSMAGGVYGIRLLAE